MNKLRILILSIVVLVCGSAHALEISIANTTSKSVYLMVWKKYLYGDVIAPYGEVYALLARKERSLEIEEKTSLSHYILQICDSSALLNKTSSVTRVTQLTGDVFLIRAEKKVLMEEMARDYAISTEPVSTENAKSLFTFKQKSANKFVIAATHSRAKNAQPGEDAESESDDTETKLSSLKQKLSQLKLSSIARKETSKELSRLEQAPPRSPEHSSLFAYLELIASLPWEQYSTDTADLKKIKEWLDTGHYGLGQVKEQIVDFIAAKIFKEKKKAGTKATPSSIPVLCLVGPPGVGKTSIAQSIAHALGRQFEKISLGGVDDPSELVGHGRTYTNSMAGRIIRAFRRTGTSNPVLVLDEIDKISSHPIHGNPSSVLLELFDSEQNKQFTDHYLGFGYDVSQAFFIATANNIDAIPGPLRDRMKIIQLPNYTMPEKMSIARHCLLPKVLRELNLDPLQFSLSDETINEIIDGYAREAGVRTLYQQITTLAVKSARSLLEHNIPLSFNADSLTKYLGARKYRKSSTYRPDSYAEDRIHALRAKIEAVPLSDEAYTLAHQQLQQIAKAAPESTELSKTLTYLEWIVELPWNKRTLDRYDLAHAKKVLDSEHSGLESVKEVVLDHLASRSLSTLTRTSPNNQRALPRILCLVGPPGVGKTTIARSIANALGRKFEKISLGSMNDAAELSGYQRMYLDSHPGQIIQALRRAQSSNPVILLDEIDKVYETSAAVLLEILDTTQNHAFKDNYLGFNVDLSEILFVATANDVYEIPSPIRDRMEIVRLPGYPVHEKITIAQNHLVPKALKQIGLADHKLTLSPEVLEEVITGYTREAGVRDLERYIAKLCSKYARAWLESKKQLLFTVKNLPNYLGARLLPTINKTHSNKIGVTNGLAWTSVGGELLEIEAILMPGTGAVQLTGQLGDVMKESARAAISYARAHAEQLGIDPTKFTQYDLHIHVPEGGIPKDGPSAGITMISSILSVLTGKAVKGNLAMTGEINLQGRVLAIGGLKEKILAAQQHGIDLVIAPKQNQKDLVDISPALTQGMKIVWADTIDEVISQALVK